MLLVIDVGNTNTVLGLYKGESLIRDWRIRTVINLRGPNPGRGWYDAEVATAAAKGVAHVDVKLKSSIIATPEKARELIAAMAAAEKPLLVHCEAGADRTGLAAALYLAAIAKAGEAAAEGQLSYVYGHVSVWPSQGRRMSQSFEALEPELGFPGS